MQTFLRSFLTIFFLALTAPAFAQETSVKVFDFDAWEKIATRAEEIIVAAEASSPALETLRATLVVNRSEALAAQEANEARVKNLKAQIAALGPMPAEGEIEPDEIAKRRTELNNQLAEANAPVLAAQEAYQRAAGLISELDAIIRLRQTSELIALGISPLNPEYWPLTYASFENFALSIKDEVSKSWASEAQRIMVRQNLPFTLALLGMGLLLLTRARFWLLNFIGLAIEGAGRKPSKVLQLVMSFVHVALPMLGLWLLIRGVENANLLTLRGALVLSALPLMGIAVFGARWLGLTLFNARDDAPRFFYLDSLERRSGRAISMWLGIALALKYLLDQIAAQSDFPREAHVVASFPIVLLGGLMLFRMGNLLDLHRAEVKKKSGERNLQDRVYRILPLAVMILGAAGPVLAVVGYFTAANFLVFPSILTLALAGTMMIVYRIFTALFAMLARAGRGKAEDAEGIAANTLVPVAIGFLLICLAIPVLALIWGARVTDIMEVWTRISEGVQIGDRRISITDFLGFALVFAVGYTVTRVLQSTLRTSVLPNTRLDAGGKNAILSGTGYIGITLAALAAITAAGIDLSNLAIVAGALSLGIGFGLQAIVSNFVSGIILLIERPIKQGDWVEVGGFSGYVKDIAVRATTIETFDRATIIVPNADLISNSVTNRTHVGRQGRTKVPVGVSYDSDPRQVEKILLEIAKANAKVMVDPAPGVVFVGFGADSMDFEIRAILYDVNNMLSARSEMNYEIVRRFREEGIEIPFAQRDINLRNLDELGAVVARSLGKLDT